MPRIDLALNNHPKNCVCIKCANGRDLIFILRGEPIPK